MLWCAVVACVLCAGAPAWAQDDAKPEEGAGADAAQGEAGEEDKPAAPLRRVKVLVLPVNSVEGKVTEIVTERLDDVTRKRLRSDDRVVLMPTFKEIRKVLAERGQTSAVMTDAEQRYASGIGLLTAGKNDEAREAFAEAVDLMEKNLADVQNYSVLTDALSNLALSMFLTGFDLDGRKRMKQFAHIMPDATLNAEKYPAELIEVLEKEQGKVKKGGPGKLTVKANVDGAKVFVDGVEKGVTPATIEDVGFGFHYLVVRDASGGSWAELVKVRGRGKPQEFEATLEQRGEKAAEALADAEQMPSFYVDLVGELEKGEYTSSGLRSYLVELSKQAGAEAVSWVTIFKDPEASNYVAAVFVFRASDERIVRGEDTTFNDELSDLTFKVDRLAGEIGRVAQEMPEEMAVEDVDLTPEPVVVAAATTGDGDGTGSGTGTGSGAGTTGDATDDPDRSPVVLANPDKKNGEGDGDIEPPKRTIVVGPTGPDIDDDPKAGRNTWAIVGYSAAGAVLLGGLIVGSVLLFGGQPPATATSFSTEVQW